MTPDELLAAWHVQQTAFIEFRDQRVRAMLDVLAASQPKDRGLRVLDLGCGPGSLGEAIATRFADAQVVGLDRDPILLRLGRETNRHGERVRLLEVDLTDPAWITQVGEEKFDAAVSATALHWLSPDSLVRLYGQLPQVLNPGAVFLNADHLGYDPVTQPFLRAFAEQEREKFRVAAVDAGAMTWDDWWEAARSLPGWEAEVRAWEQRWADKSSVVKVSLAFHLTVLQTAGFVELTHIFRWFDDVVVYARLP
ncbi:MAG: class I SAM-dependent methyltransferase [Propionibacteriaceae bacterium]|nr:class I SAM-dependent methyltransferase [Propionibacteriaceae bacterium]